MNEPWNQLTSRKTFFELMRRIEAIDVLKADPSAVGRQGRRLPDWLHLLQCAAMDFAPSEVAEVRIHCEDSEDPDAQVELWVHHRNFGLFAPYGPLPIHLTEHALAESLIERNFAFEAFVNLSSAGFAWSHYCAWSALHPVLGFDRPVHLFSERLANFAQAGDTDNAADLDGDARACRRAYPGLYMSPGRPFAALRRLCQRYFEIPVRIVPRRGRWLSVCGDSQNQGQRVGRWRLGSRVWDVQTSIDIELGPIDAPDFVRWQRGAAALHALMRVLQDYTDGRVSPAVHVRVRTTPNMGCRVGRMRMGADAWLHPGCATRRVTVYEASQEGP